MKRFIFKLEPVRRIREYELERRQQELMVVEEELHSAQGKLAQLEGAKSETLRAYLDLQMNQPDPQRLQQTYYYLDRLNRDIDAQIHVIEEIMIRVEAKRAEVREAHVKKKGLDKLRERQQERHNYEMRIEERKELDEFAAVKR